jgi:hypothetical protein
LQPAAGTSQPAFSSSQPAFSTSQPAAGHHVLVRAFGNLYAPSASHQAIAGGQQHSTSTSRQAGRPASGQPRARAETPASVMPRAGWLPQTSGIASRDGSSLRFCLLGAAVTGSAAAVANACASATGRLREGEEARETIAELCGKEKSARGRAMRSNGVARIFTHKAGLFADC